MLAVFTMSRALMGATVSIGTRPLAFNVAPVSTMSTMASASPKMGASSTLLENELGEETRRDLLREINKDARWLIRVTENILSLTKFSGSDVRLRTESEVLEEIVGSAIVKFRRNYPEISVSVSRPEQILLVPMDAVLIEQVLVNLFENVAQHAQTADQIRVSIAQQGGRALVCVEDNGAGFPPDQLPHVFEGRMAPDTARWT